jgi:DNA-binding MarR family transcriptional regulator
VAAAAGLDRSSLTQMLDLLTARDFVERRPGPDRRTVSLYLTGEGQAACDLAANKAREHESIIRGDLSNAEAAALTQLLQRIQGEIPPVRRAVLAEPLK